MNERCAYCGGAATLVLTEHGIESGICPTCLDRLMPGAYLGATRKHFYRDRKAANQCPYCGWTGEQAKKTGLFGCPLCYEALENPAVQSLTTPNATA